MHIGEVSQHTGIPVSTLRYYERRGLLRPGRDAIGQRDYTENDLDWIAFLQRLLDTGMPLAQVERYARLRLAGDSTISERIAMLQQQRARLESQRADIEERLAFLDGKLDAYGAMLRETGQSRSR